MYIINSYYTKNQILKLKNMEKLDLCLSIIKEQEFKRKRGGAVYDCIFEQNITHRSLTYQYYDYFLCPSLFPIFTKKILANI